MTTDAGIKKPLLMRCLLRKGVSLVICNIQGQMQTIFPSFSKEGNTTRPSNATRCKFLTPSNLSRSNRIGCEWLNEGELWGGLFSHRYLCCRLHSRVWAKFPPRVFREASLILKAA